MAVEQGTITLNEITLTGLDSDPTTGIGFAAPVGSVSFLGDQVSAAMWLKTGSGNTAWAPVGTVTSVALALPGIFTVSGSPVTSIGTLTGSLATQAANAVFTGPASGGPAVPTFRALVAADVSPIAWVRAGNSGTNASTDYIGTSDAVDFVSRTNGVERLRITSTGLVGIGVTPTQSLDISGQIRIRGGSPVSGYVLQSDTNGVGSWAPVSSVIGSSGIVSRAFFDDFLYNNIHNHDSPLSMTGFEASGGNVALETTAPADNSYSGLIIVGTGTNSSLSAKAALESSGGTNRIKCGGGSITVEWRVKIPVLSNGTVRFNVKAGLQGGTASGSPANGVYFEYIDNVNSGNWRGVSRNASTSTIVNGSIAPVADTWTKLRLEINSAGTLVTFYVDGVSIGTSSTNIPTTNASRLMASIERSGIVIGQNRNLYLDSVAWRIER